MLSKLTPRQMDIIIGGEVCLIIGILIFVFTHMGMK